MKASADDDVDSGVDGDADGAVDDADVGAGRGLWSQLARLRRRPAATNGKRNFFRGAILSFITDLWGRTSTNARRRVSHPGSRRMVDVQG